MTNIFCIAHEATVMPRCPAPAERMRLHQKRRRRGYRHVGIMLHVTEIEALLRKGYLPPDQRENIRALQIAVCTENPIRID